VDQGQGEANRDAGKPRGCSFRCCPDDDEQEKERHHDFAKETGAKAVFAGAEIAIAVGGEAAGDPFGLARGDDP
jgi:hypothetical protein